MATARRIRVTRDDGTLSLGPRVALTALLAAGFVLALSDPFTGLFFGSYAVIGLVLTIRRPRNPVSWLLIAIAFGFIGTTRPPNLDPASVTSGGLGPIDALFVWLGAWIAQALFLCFAALTFLFPLGELPRGRWRRPGLVALTAGVVAVIVAMGQPSLAISTDGGSEVAVANPLGFLPDGPWWDILSTATFLVPLLALGVGIAKLLSGYRVADEQTRLQLRWLIAAMALVLFGIVFGLSVVSIRGDDMNGAAWIPAIVAYPSVPIAIGVAVLRYRLYEIDRLVNRALVYGAVTAILAGVFAAATTFSQRLFVDLSGTSNDGAAVVTTLLVVALYAPVRRRVESLVDRRFKYEERDYGAYLEELRHHLDLVDPVRAAARLAREARSQTGADAVAVVDARGTVVASAGPWAGQAVETVPIDAADSPLAAVRLGRRRDGRSYDPVRLEALAAVAVVVATALGAKPRVTEGVPGPSRGQTAADAADGDAGVDAAGPGGADLPATTMDAAGST
ncbi:MAG TPA: hypothetical protein VHL56_03545 [Candidatus Limnocylindrales bacterium]|nr:hypothetical protein [Candidatus Limnocylindrales bacterium]